MKKAMHSSSVWLITAALMSEVILSYALKPIYEVAGNGAWISVLLSGAIVTAMIPIVSRCKVKLAVSAAAFLYLLVTVSRFVCYADKNLDNIAVTVAILALVVCIVGAWIGNYGASVLASYSAVTVLIIIALCVILGISEYSLDLAKPITGNGLLGIIKGAAVSFSAMSVVLVFAADSKAETNKPYIVSTAVMSAVTSGVVFLGSCTFGSTASMYGSVLTEISKCVSLGKFFQRLEGLSVIAYIVAFYATVAVLSSIAFENLTLFTLKYKKMIISGSLFAFVSVIAYLSAIDATVRSFAENIAMFAGVGVLIIIFASFAGKLTKKACLFIACSLLFTMTSCSGNDIESMVYVTSIGYEQVGDSLKYTFYGQDGKDTVILESSADGVINAVRESENKYGKKFTLKQTELLVISDSLDNYEQPIKEILSEKINNSASVVLTADPVKEIFKSSDKEFESAHDFASRIVTAEKSSEGFICEKCSKFYANLKSPSEVSVTGVISRKRLMGSAFVKANCVAGKLGVGQTSQYNKLYKKHFQCQKSENTLIITGDFTDSEKSLINDIYNVYKCDGLFIMQKQSSKRDFNRTDLSKYMVEAKTLSKN